MAISNIKAISLMEGKLSTHFYNLDDLCLYAHYSKRGNVKYVKCIDEDCDCKGKIINNHFTRTNNALHSHDDNHEPVAEYKIAYESLRLAVKNDRRPLRMLHNEAIRGLSRDAAGMLSWSQCHRTLERIRHEMMPPCRSLAELGNILEDDQSFGYLSYGRIRDTRFYQGSIGGMLIFANLELVAELPENFEMFVDATFKVVPFKARQLLVILGEMRGRPRPIVYAVMNGQTTEDYANIFKCIRDGIISFDGTTRTPRSATSDFEQAIRLALVKVWPNIRVVGCNFHFCQALRRHARGLGSISVHLIVGSMHHKIIIMFMRLSLLPLERIDAGFEFLLEFIRTNELDEDFLEFIDYFKRTWITRYPKESWHVSDRERRTNNNLEGYNHRIKQSIPANPTAWAFLDGLLNLAFDASSVYDADRINDAVPPADRSKLSEPLTIALQELRNDVINELDFLQKMSTC